MGGVVKGGVVWWWLGEGRSDVMMRGDMSRFGMWDNGLGMGAMAPNVDAVADEAWIMRVGWA